MAQLEPPIRAHGRAVSTPFGLMGKDENALSFALAYTMSRCPPLLGQLLRAAGVPRWHGKWSHDAQIDAQRHREEGITDVEVHVPGRLTLVIEAKVGGAVPTICQCRRYLPCFTERPAPRQMLLMLTEGDPAPAVADYRRRDRRLRAVLAGMSWTALLPICVRLATRWSTDTPAGRWVRAFYRFLDREYQMRAYTDEVWIVPANTQPLWPGGPSFHDTHVKDRIYYRKGLGHKRPLYIALRCRGKVSHIQKVLSVTHESPLRDHSPLLASHDAPWVAEPHTIWHLGEPTALPKAIPTRDATMRARHCSCDLDVLLASSSVREIELRMKDRRNHAAPAAE